MPPPRIVLIRAINVGGTAKLPMTELRQLATSLGATDARTHIASGNLVCAVAGDSVAFDRALETAIEQRFGFFRDVISRSRAEVESAFAAHPFDVVDPAASFITFVTGAPSAESVARASALPTGADQWRAIGREVHIRYAVSAGQPQMKTDAVMRALGVTGTARNLRTIAKLIELAG